MHNDIDGFLQEMSDQEVPDDVEGDGNQAEQQCQAVAAQQHRAHQVRGARDQYLVDAGLGRVHIKRRR